MVSGLAPSAMAQGLRQRMPRELRERNEQRARAGDFEIALRIALNEELDGRFEVARGWYIEAAQGAARRAESLEVADVSASTDLSLEARASWIEVARLFAEGKVAAMEPRAAQALEQGTLAAHRLCGDSALYTLGRLYDQGKDRPRDAVAALGYFKRLVECGPTRRLSRYGKERLAYARKRSVELEAAERAADPADPKRAWEAVERERAALGRRSRWASREPLRVALLRAAKLKVSPALHEVLWDALMPRAERISALKVLLADAEDRVQLGERLNAPLYRFALRRLLATPEAAALDAGARGAVDALLRAAEAKLERTMPTFGPGSAVHALIERNLNLPSSANGVTPGAAAPPVAAPAAAVPALEARARRWIARSKAGSPIACGFLAADLARLSEATRTEAADALREGAPKNDWCAAAWGGALFRGNGVPPDRDEGLRILCETHRRRPMATRRHLKRLGLRCPAP